MEDKLTVLVIESDNDSLIIMRGLLEELKYVEVIEETHSLNIGYNLAIQYKPSVILVDISENVNWGLTRVEKLATQLKDSMIFITSAESSLDVAIKSMRAGAREFLAKPINSDEFINAFEKAKEFILRDDSLEKSGSLFTIFSNKGGIGKTTLATNLAVYLTRETGKRVALIDLNLQLGDVTTFLDIQPTYDISYIVKNISRVDEAFLLSTMEKFENYELYVLADPPYAEQAEDISSEQINTVLTVLKTIFDYVIIDTTSSFDSKTITALDIADKILLVSMVNLPCIRNTQRCLDLFNRLNYDKDKTHLIINRYVATDEISIEDVEDTLEHPVFWKVPNNYFTVMAAINRGVPIIQIEEDSNISLNFRQFARKLANLAPEEHKAEAAPEKEKKPKTSIFQSLFSKKGS